MMRTLVISTAAALLLGACATPAERSASMQREMDQMMVIYGPACQKLGFTAQSDPWRNCVLQLSTKEELSNVSLHGSYAYSPYRPYYRHWPYW